MNKALKTLTNGLLKENPTLRLVLGTCPTLAVTTSALFGLGMGVSVTAVLIGSNIAISLCRKVIPDKVRIPAFITIIAGFVTIVQLLLEAYVPALNESLGIFIPLIVVNCIILARAEMFACKNNAFLSALDAIGMGMGFTFALLLIGTIREIFGNGTWFGIKIAESFNNPAVILILPPGGFFVFGIVIAIVNKLSKKKTEYGNCQSCGMCKMVAGECEKTGVTDRADGADGAGADGAKKVNITEPDMNTVDAGISDAGISYTGAVDIGIGSEAANLSISDADMRSKEMDTNNSVSKESKESKKSKTSNESKESKNSKASMESVESVVSIASMVSVESVESKESIECKGNKESKGEDIQ